MFDISELGPKSESERNLNRRKSYLSRGEMESLIYTFKLLAQTFGRKRVKLFTALVMHINSPNEYGRQMIDNFLVLK